MTRLSLWPEWGRRSPVWGAPLESLPISPDLRRRLEYWAVVWNVNWGETIPEWSDASLGEAWLEEGNALLDALRGQLGAEYTVEGSFHIYRSLLTE